MEQTDTYILEVIQICFFKEEKEELWNIGF